MKRTVYDVPIGQAKGTPSALVPKIKKEKVNKSKKRTLTEIAKEYGIHRNSVVGFRRRHPECKDWPIEKICEQIAKNKNKSATAKRQGVEKFPDKRPSFKKVKYED